jgi:iron complex outermembrane recepter protein
MRGKSALRSKLSFLPVSLLIVIQLQAQTVTVSFRITDKKNDRVPFATLSIFDRADSSQTIQLVADSNGKAATQLTKDVQYLVKITAVNYKPIEKGIRVGSQNNYTFVLEELSKTLKEVVVTSNKPLIRQEDDKTIVDPEPIAATSTNAYEILEKTPGIFVDQDGNVYLSNMSPAAIYVNGHDLKMSTADITTMLKNLPPNAILRIEILRTPSAKYDAASSGGIVNIVLKKGVKLGLTGNLNAGAQQGVYGNQFLSFNLNNNTEKKRSYVNFNINNRNNYETIETDRLFKPDSVLSQKAKTLYPGRNYWFSYGVGYSLGEKWELEYDGRINLNYFDNKTNNRSIIKNINDGQVKSDNLTI